MDRKKIALDFSKSIKSPEIDEIILYGSVARDEDSIDSDIDILILSNYEDEISDKIYDKIVEIILDLGERISLHIISKKDFEELQFTPYIQNIKKEGIKIG